MCHSYVIICHPYVTRMYAYVIRMSLICGFTMNHFKVLIEKKIGRWSERSDFIMPFLKDSSKIFVVMTSIIVANFLATRVSLFIKAIAPYSNGEL